jgi:hypothetical protein
MFIGIFIAITISNVTRKGGWGFILINVTLWGLYQIYCDTMEYFMK